jgi:hypothetical protein
MGTADYAHDLMNRVGGDRRTRPFIGPMAPFVDPGSLAFEQPEKHGYRILFRTLEEHRQALVEPSWQFTLNYETKWMTRREIVLATYDAGMGFCEAKATHGLVNAQTRETVMHALAEGRRLSVEIEALRERGALGAIDDLRGAIDALNATRILEANDELQFHAHRSPFKWHSLVPLIARQALRRRPRRAPTKA